MDLLDNLLDALADGAESGSKGRLTSGSAPRSRLAVTPGLSMLASAGLLRADPPPGWEGTGIVAVTPDSGGPPLRAVSGFVVNPTESLIANGDFSSYVPEPGGTSVTFPGWNTTPGGLGAIRGGSSFPDDPFFHTQNIQFFDSVSNAPVFDAKGVVVNQVDPDPVHAFAVYQTVEVVVGQQYILSFSTEPDSRFHSSFMLTDRSTEGFFAVAVTGHPVLRLRSDPDNPLDYQLRFTAQSTQTTVAFVNEGIANKGLAWRADTAGWDLQGGQYSFPGTWDDISLTAIPEPLAAGLAFSISAIGILLVRRWHGRRRQV